MGLALPVRGRQLPRRDFLLGADHPVVQPLNAHRLSGTDPDHEDQNYP